MGASPASAGRIESSPPFKKWAALSRAVPAQDGPLQKPAAAPKPPETAKVDRMTQQNAALVEQGAAAAESLKHPASKLATLVGSFKLAA